ncbi:SRPBCC domain-containing protein [Sporosarcina thermotolerans]|uniref:SRPBCC domain-containing protein n=1 Tax=Sporosarcina thermotolerans TaxID=633404 RepID=A0AAW9ADF7_9BACL|nr:SRPBCC domain-containing protein [Sporosarcina thermotolerans]MDW0118234.1 SRPBCC domain-containing protein [Sporosarcina thermotolerans]WHT48546.1 SRPBCC domain-containing protein [Sporosarcina thermotolerans]
MSENQIKKNIIINASIEKVWPYVSTAEGIGAWFMPSDMQPIEGKEFTLQAGPWGESQCKVTEVQTPNRLSFDWGKDWQIHFELKGNDGKTEMTFSHAGWEDGKQTEFGEKHEVVRPRMSGGWDGLLAKLKKIIDAETE